ncbi:MAG: sulfatase [Chloroflexota bacterium]|nr:sulfatase [Chloroflexota bacterium]
MNVILIVSDTLRRDYLPCYGNAEVITPNLDRFAERALIFEDCYAASFPTVPARADLMTGRYTFVYLPWGPLPQSEATLAGIISEGGRRTAAIADTPFLARRGYGQDRGFGEFIYVRGQLDGTERAYRHRQRQISEIEGYCAPKTFVEAADWLERHHEDPFFLYIDTWDPHEPWDPPSYYVKPYLADYSGAVIPPSYWEYQDDGVTARDLEIARACYMGEISMVDHWFGYLMERVRVLNLLDDTAIIFVSDHGFYFGEHGLFGKRRFRWPDGSGFEEGFAKGLTVHQRQVHRSPLHNELIQVPLLAYLPGVAGRRVSGLLSLPDIMPTILNLLELEIPARTQAKSALPLLNGQAIHDQVATSAPFEEVGELSKTVDGQNRVVMEISPSSITDGEWDLLFGIEGQKVELYRSKEDAGHQKDLSAAYPEIVEAMHSRYVEWLIAIDTPERFLAPRRRL